MDPRRVEDKAIVRWLDRHNVPNGDRGAFVRLSQEGVENRLISKLPDDATPEVTGLDADGNIYFTAVNSGGDRVRQGPLNLTDLQYELTRGVYAPRKRR